MEAPETAPLLCARLSICLRVRIQRPRASAAVPLYQYVFGLKAREALADT